MGSPTPAPRGSAPTAAISFGVELRDLNRSLSREVRAQTEAAGNRFVAFFGVRLEGPLVVPLRYFPDSAAFRDHLARDVPHAVTWAGYYDPRKREIVVGASTDYRAILIHEVNHFVFDTAFDEAPVWLREGLAEYFETAAASAGGLVVQDRPSHRRQLARWLRGDHQPALPELLALNYSTWLGHELEDGQRLRALSWSIVDFLMSSPGGQSVLQGFMARLKDQRGLHSLEALNRTYPGGATAFEDRWLQHVQARATGT